MDKISIYNKSSADISEVDSSSVDLIVTSPPYNIKTKYGENDDNLTYEDYTRLISDVFTEANRVLKDEGALVIECADSVVSNGKYIQLAGYIQSICLDIGFHIKERHINFINSENGKELLDHGWEDDYTTDIDAHSNCHQILVFSKSSKTEFSDNGKVFYFTYKSSENHPCPFPAEMRDLVLDSYFKKGFIVLDPFMGIGSIAKDVVERGGFFVGYEIDRSIFEVAQERLNCL